GLSVAGASFSAYHVLAKEDNGTLAAILESGRLTPESRQATATPNETGSPQTEEVVTDTDREQIVGSGKPLTKEFKIADFDSVNIPSVFEVEISQGDPFPVPVTADDNLFDYIKAAKEGTTLTFALDSKDKSIQTKERLKAKVTMPSLRNLKINGAAKATLSGFKSSPEVSIEVNGASALKGSLETKKITLKVVGASHI